MTVLGATTIFSGLTGFDLLRGGAGDDTIDASNSFDTLEGGAGDDFLDGGTGFDTLDGGAGVDTATYANRAGGVEVNLFAGAAKTAGFLNAGGFYQGGFTEDTLISVENAVGSAFGDRLIGDNGANVLEGGAGDDRLSGLAGDDIFRFALGDDNDTITDFSAGAGTDDVINVAGFGAAFDTFAEVMAAASDIAGDVVIDFGGGDTLTLENTAVAALHQDDFTFG